MWRNTSLIEKHFATRRGVFCNTNTTCGIDCRSNPLEPFYNGPLIQDALTKVISYIKKKFDCVYRVHHYCIYLYISYICTFIHGSLHKPSSDECNYVLQKTTIVRLKTWILYLNCQDWSIWESYPDNCCFWDISLSFTIKISMSMCVMTFDLRVKVLEEMFRNHLRTEPRLCIKTDLKNLKTCCFHDPWVCCICHDFNQAR